VIEDIVVKPIPDAMVEECLNKKHKFPSLKELYRQFIKDCVFQNELADVRKFVPVTGKRYFLVEHKGKTEALFGVTFTNRSHFEAQISFSRIIDPEICRYIDNHHRDELKLEIRWPAGIAKGWMYLDSLVQELFKREIRTITSKALSKGGISAFRSFRKECGGKYEIDFCSSNSSLLVKPLLKAGG